MDHSVWVMPARYFARHQFNVVAPDLPGHGKSDGIPLRSVTAMSEWLMQVFFTVHCDSAIVIGHGMGSLVAMQFACTYPERCTAIVLLGTSVPMPVASILLDAAKDNDPLAFEMANIWSHSRGASLGVNQSPRVWTFGAEARLLNRSKDGVFYADLTVCNEFQFEPAGLARISHNQVENDVFHGIRGVRGMECRVASSKRLRRAGMRVFSPPFCGRDGDR